MLTQGGPRVAAIHESPPAEFSRHPRVADAYAPQDPAAYAPGETLALVRGCCCGEVPLWRHL